MNVIGCALASGRGVSIGGPVEQRPRCAGLIELDALVLRVPQMGAVFVAGHVGNSDESRILHSRDSELAKQARNRGSASKHFEQNTNCSNNDNYPHNYPLS